MHCVRHTHAKSKYDNNNAAYMHIKTNDHNYINTKPMNYSRMETPKHARIALPTSMKCQQIHKKIIRAQRVQIVHTKLMRLHATKPCRSQRWINCGGPSWSHPPMRRTKTPPGLARRTKMPESNQILPLRRTTRQESNQILQMRRTKRPESNPI